MENVKSKEVFVDQWTADLFSNFTGVSGDQWTLDDPNSNEDGHYRESLIERAQEFIAIINEHFEGTSLNNSAEEIVDHYIATAD